MKVHPQHTICIQGGHVFDPAQGLDGVMDIFIENDAIVALGTAPQGFMAGETIQAKGQHVFPGFIDTSGFLAEPGFNQKGTIEKETQAAARSGITLICSTPNTKPVVDSSAVAALIQDKAKQAGYCQVKPFGALTAGLEGEQLSNMHGLKEAGCKALSQMGYPFKDARVIKQCYHYAAGFDITVVVTPKDHALAQGGCMAEGSTSTRLGLAGIAESAETSALAQHIILAKETGVKLHVSRINSATALNMILDAQQKGVRISADVALGNLVYTNEDCIGYDSLMHVVPVYRSEQDRQALLNAVNQGQIGICSNHMPHDLAAKMAPFAASEPGISTYDTFAGVLLDLVAKGELTLEGAIQAVASQPANVLGIKRSGIQLEAQANLCIADLNAATQVTEQTMASGGANNPWLEQRLKGAVTCTINGGHIVFSS